jgi:hypothetical protein
LAWKRQEDLWYMDLERIGYCEEGRIWRKRIWGVREDREKVDIARKGELGGRGYAKEVRFRRKES